MQSKHLKIRPQYAFLGRCVLGLAALFVLRLLGGVYVDSQREAIAAAIVQERIKSSAPAIIFVSIDDKDPSNDFIRRFSGSKTLVRKPSQGTHFSDGSTGDPWNSLYVDKISRKSGLLLDIGQPVWRVPLFVEVGVSYPGMGESFSLFKGLRGWKIRNKKMSWIA